MSGRKEGRDTKLSEGDYKRGRSVGLERVEVGDKYDQNTLYGILKELILSGTKGDFMYQFLKCYQ